MPAEGGAERLPGPHGQVHFLLLGSEFPTLSLPHCPDHYSDLLIWLRVRPTRGWITRSYPPFHLSVQLIKQAGYELKQHIEIWHFIQFESPHSFWVQHYCSKYKNPAFPSFRRTYRAFVCASLTRLVLCDDQDRFSVMGTTRNLLTCSTCSTWTPLMETGGCLCFSCVVWLMLSSRLFSVHSAGLQTVLHITTCNEYHVLIIFLLIICN